MEKSKVKTWVGQGMNSLKIRRPTGSIRFPNLKKHHFHAQKCSFESLHNSEPMSISFILFILLHLRMNLLWSTRRLASLIVVHLLRPFYSSSLPIYLHLLLKVFYWTRSQVYGGSTNFVAFLVVVVSAVSNFNQIREFDKVFKREWWRKSWII